LTDLLAIVLAAGEGTRMRSSVPKVLHEVGGLPIIGHVVRAAVGAGAGQVAVVTPPGHEGLRRSVAAQAPGAAFFEQTERKGTGHAATMARPLWSAAEGYVAVV
jgi:bifunctional UDP-N-acetylglucosamine pyrophosphorylase/glucosamine-1-phosphate N-acetyltransferase